MVHMSIVALLVGFTLVGVHAAVDDDELVAIIDALAAETRTAVDERTYGTEDSCAVKNVAINKPAKASSTFSPYSAASLVVDGNLEQKFFGSTSSGKTYCFSTLDKPHANKWWYVDLQQSYIIERLKFYNRIDCCLERGGHFKILVGDTLENMNEVSFVETMGSTKTVTLPKNTRGRYVKLFQAITSVFHMCEVEVYGIPVCCSNPCRKDRTCYADNSNARGYKCEACARSSDYMTTGANCEETWVKLPSKRTYDLVPRP